MHYMHFVHFMHFKHTINLEILEENLYDSIACYRDSFLTDAFTNANVNTSTGSVLFLYSYTVALFRYVNGTGNVGFFLFNSYCMNSGRITDGEPGFLVLIKFDSLFQIERYIEEAYQLSGKVYPPYFQFQFISVNCNATKYSVFSDQLFLKNEKAADKSKKEFTGKARHPVQEKFPNDKNACKL